MPLAFGSSNDGIPHAISKRRKLGVVEETRLFAAARERGVGLDAKGGIAAAWNLDLEALVPKAYCEQFPEELAESVGRVRRQLASESVI